MLPLSPAKIAQLYQSALKLQAQGAFPEAIALYTQILDANPKIAEAQFQIGLIHSKTGDPAQAIRYFQQAATLKPKEGAIWAAYADAVSKLNDLKASNAFLRQAKSAGLPGPLLDKFQHHLKPKPQKSRTSIGAAAPAEIKRAIGYLQNGQLESAVQVASALRRAHPDVAIIADILANAQAGTGAFEDAEQNFRAALRLDPKYAETRSNFGRFLIERDRADEGIEMLQQALKLAPNMASAMVHLGVGLKRKNYDQSAIAAFRKALDLVPDNREARFELGQLLVGEQQPTEALDHLKRAGDLGADKIEVQIWTARALSAMGQGDDALAVFDEILAEFPDHAEAISSQALIYQSLGRFAEAGRAFRRAIALEPGTGRYYRNYLTSEKLAADDPLIGQMQEKFADPDIPDGARINFGFALAKVMEDTKQYNRVFTYLRPANDLMRKNYPYKIESLVEQVEALKDSFRPVDFAHLQVPNRSDYAPIFVTGLPRSGTTLVEQIIASHSAVTGGGELGFARRLWGDVLIGPDTRVRPWQSVTPEIIAAMGHETAKQMRAQFPDTDRVTDKSVQSYTMIGPIRASLPNARFIVVKRDPRDNLLSMYKNVFAGGKHLHSYNLRDLAIYFRVFEDIIAFWQEKLPDWFHIIQYESLIADPESQARALIAACGLDWENECLSFYENKRRVDTLSVHQVRQPIYASSMQTWKRYEGELGEMLDALGGEYATDRG